LKAPARFELARLDISTQLYSRGFFEFALLNRRKKQPLPGGVFHARSADLDFAEPTLEEQKSSLDFSSRFVIGSVEFPKFSVTISCSDLSGSLPLSLL